MSGTCAVSATSERLTSPPRPAPTAPLTHERSSHDATKPPSPPPVDPGDRVAAVACGDDDETVTTDDPAADDGGTDPADDDDPLGGGPYPIADLTVSYEHPDEGVSFTYRDHLPRRYRNHHRRRRIDDRRAGGLPRAWPNPSRADAPRARVPPPDQVCTEIYGGPDVARVTGTIDEQPVDATIDRTNGCGIGDWDDLLGAVLPESDRRVGLRHAVGACVIASRTCNDRRVRGVAAPWARSGPDTRRAGR